MTPRVVVAVLRGPSVIRMGVRRAAGSVFVIQAVVEAVLLEQSVMGTSAPRAAVCVRLIHSVVWAGRVTWRVLEESMSKLVVL